MQTKLGHGEDGINGATKMVLNATSFSTPSTQTRRSDYSEPLPWPFTKEDFHQKLMKPWPRTQSEVPYHTWHRPSGKTMDQLPPKTKTESLADFYQEFLDLSKTKTQKDTTEGFTSSCPLGTFQNEVLKNPIGDKRTHNRSICFCS